MESASYPSCRTPRHPRIRRLIEELRHKFMRIMCHVPPMRTRVDPFSARRDRTITKGFGKRRFAGSRVHREPKNLMRTFLGMRRSILSIKLSSSDLVLCPFLLCLLKAETTLPARNNVWFGSTQARLGLTVTII